MHAYSVDLRQRIVDALSSGLTIAQTAVRFSVGTTTVKRYKSRLKTMGSLASTPVPGRSPKIKPEQHEAFRALVASRSDWTLVTLAEACQKEMGASAAVTVSIMSDTLRRLKITYKKSAASPPSATRRSALFSGSR